MLLYQIQLQHTIQNRTYIQPLEVDHLSAIQFETHNFLSDNNDGVILNPNSTTNDLQIFNFQPQSFSEAPTFATLTTRISRETSSNDNISFNSALNNINNSYVSQFVRQILQEDEEEECDPEIVNLPSTSASMASSAPTCKHMPELIKLGVLYLIRFVDDTRQKHKKLKKWKI